MHILKQRLTVAAGIVVFLSFLLAAMPAAAQSRAAGTGTNTERTRIALHAGGTGSYSSGLLLGLDITLPSMRTSSGWSGRLDIDTWAFGLFGSNNSGTSIMLSQVSPSAAQPTGIYFGYGAGYMRLEDSNTSRSGLGAKVILGANVTSFLGLETALHYGEGHTVAAGFLRIRF